MSDETTPRPWAHVRNVYEGLSAVEIGDDCHGAMRPADADLIVTAVNQHDALVAFVDAVRAWDAIFPVSTDVTDALADLDAQIGGN